MMSGINLLKVGIAQIAPVWLDKKGTLDKIYASVEAAAKESCELVVFGEALLPGYPFWIELTDGAKFNSKAQKELHAHYIRHAVEIEKGDLEVLCEMAKSNELSIYLGTIERAANRGGHSLYCSLVYINQEGSIQSVHRKLQPTYEERLSWAPGDGHGLQVHSLKEFTVGGLNCWENWMPLSRTALYGQGENLHVAVWPGNEKNTFDITKFIAKEGRSFVISASGLMKKN
ncbi:nitrilase-related carbon-nitrogen hydrolase [Reichenbachiella sp.]|uniref:nitrilase-related carbon-nitrogen hydrolase n=1 Tax=Reichenbachiella sp. TaxID=2184521 RepID=UPI003B5A167A